jgi:S-DNA-T family DNA segregation ATPase FtsK/SpoIIIE
LFERHATCVELDQAHVLIAGLSGTGKSSALRTLLVGAARDPTVALVLVDAKRVELRSWQPRATAAFTEPDAITAGLTAVSGLVDDRYRLMEANGATSWPVSTTTPRVLFVVDELAALTASGARQRDRAHTAALRHILKRGRAAGVVVVAAIQRPPPMFSRPLCAICSSSASCTPPPPNLDRDGRRRPPE